MFKGLKSKIAEETKRIQDAVVSQVGEGLNSFTAKRNENFKTPNPNNQTSSDLLDVTFSDSENQRSPSRQSISDSFVSAESSSSFMQEAEGELTPTRQRHDSVSSMGSVDSFFPSIPPTLGRLAPIQSDIETDVESVAGSSNFISGASKEQISSVLTKLQGRAANYKDKYRLTVLTTSQDKALRRIQDLKEERIINDKNKREMEENLRSKLLSQDGMISSLKHQVQLLKEGKPVDEDVLQEIAVNHPPTAVYAEREKVKKLEELLTRCKDSIKSYKEKIQTLSVENQELKKKLNHVQHENQGNSEISDFAAGRSIEELKSKLKSSDEVWEKRYSDLSESSALNLAQMKQEMHTEIERKDQTIEELRKLIKTAEKKSLEMNENLKQELEKAKEAERLLEEEKKELIQEVSKSKQTAVLLLKEEEEKKREELHKNFEQNLIEKTAHFEKKLKDAKEEFDKKITEKDKEYSIKIKDYEEQMNLAIEERDLQKMAALSQHDERIDRLQADVESLKTEKLQLESELMNTKQEGKRNLAEMLQKSENRLKSNFENELLTAQKNFDIQIADLNKHLADSRTEVDEIFSEKSSLESQLEELRKEFAASRDEFRRTFDENEKLRRNLAGKDEELSRISTEIANTSDDQRQLTENLKNLHITLRDRDDQVDRLKSELGQLQRLHDELSEKFESNSHRCEFMEKELQRILDEKRAVELDFKERLEKLGQSKSVEVADVQKQLEDLKNMEISQLKSELDRSQQELGQRESALKQELQKRNDESMFSRQEISSKDDVITSLRRQLDDHVTEIDRLTASRDDLANELRQAVAKRTEYESELEKFKDLSRTHESVAMQLEDARVHVKNLEQEKLFTLEEKNMQIRESGEVLGALEEAIDLYRKQLDSQVKESESTKQNLLKDAKFQITERESRLNDLKDRVSDLEDAVDVYKSQHMEKAVLVQQKNQEISNLSEKLTNLIRDSFFYSSEKDLRINELSEELVQLELAVEDYKKQNEILRKETHEFVDIRNQLSVKSQELENLHIANEGLLKELNSYTENQSELNSKLDVKNLEQEKLFTLEEKNMQIRESGEVLGALEEAIDLYRKQLDSQMKESESTKQNLLKDAKFQITERESRLNDLKDRVSDLEDAVDVYKSQHMEKAVLVQQKNQEISNLSEKLTNLIRDSFFYSSEKDLRINELSEELVQLELAVEDYKKQNEILRKETHEFVDIRNQLSVKSQELENLHIANEGLLKELNSYTENQSELNSKLELLQNQLENSLLEIQTLKRDNIELKNELNKRSDDARNEEESTKMLENLVNDFKCQLDAKKAEFESTKFDLNEIHEFVEKLVQRLRQFFEKSIDLSEESRDDKKLYLSTNFDRILCKFIENKSILDQLHTKLTGCDEKLKNVENEFNSMSGKLAEKENLVAQLNSNLTSANEKQMEIRLTFDEKLEEIRLLTEEIALLKDRMKKSDEILHQNDQTLSANRREFDKELKDKTKEFETLKSELKLAQDQIGSLENQLSSAKDSHDFEKERLNQECEIRVADYKKKAETKLSQIKKLLENDKETLSQRVVDMEIEIREKSLEIEQLKTDALSNLNSTKAESSEFEEKQRQLMESVEKRHKEELTVVTQRNAEEVTKAVNKCREEYESKLAKIVEDHNDRVKQMAKEFQAEISSKETEWQDELSTAYNRKDEDRERVTKEYQKGMKQLYQDLQEKGQKIEQLKLELEEEKTKEIQSLVDEHEKILLEKEDQYKTALKQRLEEIENQHKLELDGLMQEWNIDRRQHISMPTVGTSNNTNNQDTNVVALKTTNLEKQAQVAQGDVQVESTLYMKQRVKQLESQLEGLKEKLKRDNDHSAKNSDPNRTNNNSYVARDGQERLSSVSLDYSNPMFCEPTEAEYLRNIVFRYMVERESLGRESVTLAKAIAAVLKLSFDQTKEVLSKEEARLSSW